MKNSLWLVVFLIFPNVAFADCEGKVVAIEAFAGGGGTAFVFAQDSPPGRTALSSSSVVVQGALIRAFMTGAKVKVITEGTTSIIRRVEAFEPGNGLSTLLYGEYRVNRLATQRTKDGDLLEVFLIKGNNPETQFLVYDETLQPLFFAVFESKRPVPIPVQIKYDDKTVVAVRIGEK